MLYIAARESLTRHYEFCAQECATLTKKAEELGKMRWTNPHLRQEAIVECKFHANRYAEEMNGIEDAFGDEGLNIRLDEDGKAVVTKVEGE